jgi:hypothetical protein
MQPIVIINTPNTSAPLDPSAALELADADRGFLPNRLTTVQRDAIVDPASGLLIFNTTTAVHEFFNGSSWTGIGGSSAPNYAVGQTNDMSSGSAGVYLAYGADLVLTPLGSGVVFVSFFGQMVVSMGVSGTAILYYGSGTVPIGSTNINLYTPINQISGNQDGLPGTQIGAAFGGIVAGLTVGTPYWFDLIIAPDANVDVTLLGFSSAAFEL